ncbi:MAG: FtsX-like permease family protein, partial [Actinomyces sp.]|nr:FtsX-like permease family protein [Actinomyces sp.]
MSTILTAARAVLGSRDRATSILTVLAFALPHAILLSVTGGVLMFFTRTYDLPEGFEGMGGFYVLLACFAGLLMIVPTLSMGAAAARLGMSRRARDLAVLRLMGLGPAKTRLACLIETAVYAAIGVVCGTALYGALLPVWQLISFQGERIGVHEMWVGPLVLLA